MTRGHRPFVAIRETAGILTARGAVIVTVSPECGLPFDLVTWEGGVITLIRVRRLKYAGYGVEDVAISCAREIAELRRVPAPDQIYRELYVRGPDRHWHRYLVLPDRIEMLDDLSDLIAG
jgi:hypothetical protein